MAQNYKRAACIHLGQALMYLAPSLVIFIIFVFYPLAKSFRLSLYNTDLLGNEKIYVGFQRYSDLFSSVQFGHSLWTTFLFTVYTVVPGIIIALLLAYIANWQLKGISVFRTFFAFPLSIAVTSASMIFMMMFNPSSGLITYFLNLFHLPAVSWLSDPNWALVAVSIVAIWRGVGFNTIILLSGLQSIPQQLYESARIDGAGSWKLFINITLPLLSPVLFFSFIISVINSLQAFGEINILTQGGPADATNVIVYSIYREGFFNLNYGYASAEAIVLFGVILTITLFEFWLLERKVFYR
ncbi:MAG TPA: sugar ABC transporter permease [Negativicutes bacterium]